MKFSCPVNYKLDNCSSKEYGLTCDTCFHSYKTKYNSPDYDLISCEEFGQLDGMNGSCHYCLEDTPYEFEMCSDESWKRSLMRASSRMPNCSECHAIQFIDNYKSKYGKELNK